VSGEQKETARSVLLVDDSPYWLDAVAGALREAGYVVTTVTDGLEAVEQLRAHPPRILVTDFFLPNVDGGKLCQLAKQLAPVKPPTTIILTGGADKSLSRRPSEHADAVIAKNVREVVLSDLFAALRELRSGESQPPLSISVIGHERLEPRALSSKLFTVKQHLDALHEGIADAVIGIDGRRRVYFVNAMAVELLGRPEQDLLARSFESVFELEEGNPVLAGLNEALGPSKKRAAPSVVEFRERTLRVSITPLKNPLGDGSALLIAADITDIVAVEAERESLVEQLHAAEKMRSLGQMTAGIAHEINNPLAALLPNLQLLGEYYQKLTAALRLPEAEPLLKDPELQFALAELPELLSDTNAAGAQIKSVVGEMLRYAHPGVEKGERTALPELLNEALSLLSRRVRFRATLIREYGETPELVVDRGLLGQAVLNIAINASQAIASRSSEDAWIKVKTEPCEGGVAIEISNSGPEIPAAVAKDIFAPFFTTKDPGTGVGLGLSIAYESVRRHGGFIEVLDGLPTTFRVWLPLETGRALVSLRPAHAAPTTRASVMVVDDEHLVRKGLRRVLERHFEVTLASGGREALQLLGSHCYDVILCDLLMPGLTGMQLYQEASKDFPQQAECFVFLTGGTTAPEAREFLRSVPNPRVYKPVERSELVALVDKAARNTRQRKAPAL
jgi:signal transduction histidine kinase/FixJ family two-component response regulator